ncbi:uncharacterized protein LOC118279006 [Spodoptera frugiperda]|uniref:Uncharacterized protein LOC118279006 n=1 Tax=Spodoptera frugiperda TaxID=7108 RepID=A0A9R0F3W3_SPOFR|nr:uncharacterized protein LOC118279006 [Spodoptera frugiperda]
MLEAHLHATGDNDDASSSATIAASCVAECCSFLNGIMESWDAVVTSYPEHPAPIHYAKAVRTASIIIADDLAPFETEWLTKTLLFKPVHLFETIKSKEKRKNEEWVKYIADSFKLLSKLVECYWDALENYSQELVELCSLSFDAQTRKEAILCLLKVLKRPSVVLTDEFVENVISAFTSAKDCKAPLAELIGALCKYFPEMVTTENRYEVIWKKYLGTLKTDKGLTNALLVSLLRGVDDLLTTFGEHLDIEELESFYRDASVSAQKKYTLKAFEVLISILKHHAGLFQRVLVGDTAIRNYLWTVDKMYAMEALIKIYQVILPLMDDNNARDVISSEIKPRIATGSVLVKHTALKVMMQATAGQPGEEMVLSSGIDLEYQLRTKRVDYDEAATIAWCIESNLANSGNMLLTAIMFYDNLPTNRKRDIVVNGIFKASDDVRKAALVLLLNLSVQEGLDKYIDVWRRILDNSTGPDLGKAVMIFKEIVHHILRDLATTIGNEEKSYTDVKPILSVLGVILSLQQTEHSTPKWCHSIIPSLVHLAMFYRQEPVEMIQHTADDEMPYEEVFKDGTVYKTLLTIMTTDRQAVCDGTLSSFHGIFSQEGVDYKVLTKILANLTAVIEENSSSLDRRQLSLVINQIERLKYKIVLDSKDARTFQKDVIIFLAKYGQMCLQGSFSEDIYTLKLKDKVYFDIPNILQGFTLKIDLQRILQLCLSRGETDALYCLLLILTASLRDRPDPGLQEATIRVIHEIFRTTSGKSETDIDVYPALFMCNTTACVQSIIKGITEELNPQVRRKLSEHLQVVITQDPGSEAAGELLNVVAEHTSFIIARDKEPISLPDLDILRAFLQSILDNNALITEYLPKIIIYTSTKRDATDMFEKASDLIVEKIDLFTEDQILELIKKLIESYSLNLLNTELIIKNVVNFIKRVFEIKEIVSKNIIDISLSMLPALTVISPQFSHLVTLLVYLNRTFEFDNGLRRMLVEFENWKILEQLSMMEIFEENNVNAGFLFLCEFADQLLEFSTEKTYKCLGLLIQNVSPQFTITLKNNITKCLSVYQRKQALIPIKENIQNWFTKNYNIDELTSLIKKWFKGVNPEELIDDIEKRESFANFTKDVSVKIHALKIFTEYFEFEFDSKKLTLISIENIHAKDELSKIFLTDLLSVCEKKLSAEDFSLLLGMENDFLKEYVGVYFKRVVSKPYVVREDQCHILIDAMNYFATAFDKNCYQDVLDFINYLWPALQNSSNFEGKLSVLTNVLSLPETVDLACPPVAWAETLLSAEESSLEDKIKILSALPAGQQFSSLYRSFASNLPVRVSEMQANEKFVPAFRALLDSLAINGDKTLLDIVLTLAKGDETKGWWDHAFAACMKSLAAKEDIEIFNMVYKTAVGRTMNFSNRILLPLLRHTSRKFLENFLCTIINDLLSTLKTVVKGSSQSEDYKRRLIQYAITFNILKIAFDKLSSAQLEKGVLNERAGSPKPWHFLQTVCCYCMAVRDAVKQSENPSEASDELKSTYLWFHTSYYNCLSAALCRRQLTKKFSAKLFDVHAWDDLVDKQAVYPFHLKSYVRSRDSVRPARRALDSLATTSSFTGTLRSAIFLNTLSDNPLYYDLIPNEEEQDEEDDAPLEFEDSILNAHGCLSTMTYLLEHVSRLEYHEWRESVVSALSDGDVHINVKWMIAQAICNASEELKPHATALCPALFELIAYTARSTNDSEHRVLNNLHIDILTTIIKWDLKDLVPPPNVTKCAHYLIYTCLENQSQYYIHKRLLDTLNGLLKLYGQHIRVDWNLFQDCSQDLQKSPILPILERLLKNGVLYGVSDLLSAIFALDAKDWLNNGTKLYEVVGLALSRERNSAFTENLDKFWRILASVRRNGNVGSYVKMLYYAQKSCPQCCDADNLRIITGIAASKIEKAKCLAIISTYLEHLSVDNFAHITDLIGLKELFDSEFRVEAMKIARNGLKCADSRLKSEILNGLEHNCQSSSVPVRKEAFNVFLKAFQDLVKPEATEAEAPAAKRIALDNSPILSIIDSANSLDREVVKMVSDGMFDRDLVVAREVCDGVQECLSEDLEMRFAELFYIIVYQRSLTENNSHFSTYGSKLIEILFSGLRQKDTFKQLKLSNKGLSPSIHTGFGNSAVPQTMSIGTVLRSGLTYRSRHKAPEKRQIDLEMPITDIIEVFIKVSKINSQICQELCVQIMKCLAQTGGSRFDLGSVMAKYLSDIIKKPFCLTPLVLEACRIFINDISIGRFLDSVKCLKQSVHNSEGYLYTNVLFEDLLTRCGDESLITFG